MTNLELLIALAYTPLGVAMAIPYVLLAVAGIHHMWVHRAPTNKRTRVSAVRRRV